MTYTGGDVTMKIEIDEEEKAIRENILKEEERMMNASRQMTISRNIQDHSRDRIETLKEQLRIKLDL